MDRLEAVSEELKWTPGDLEFLTQCAITALGSKIVSRDQRHLAEICAKAVLAVADLDRRDVNLDLIKVQSKGAKRGVVSWFRSEIVFCSRRQIGGHANRVRCCDR